MTAEDERIREARDRGVPWRMWGPYLSERQWGTVRENCGADGDAWGDFTHDQARSRVYEWGEDGLAGICDEKIRLCFAIALWNGRDRILKERLFGLANGEADHGGNVKECYFYLDNVPTHSYMRMLYKYPHREFPYANLIQRNRQRGWLEAEYELIDTGIFEEDRYFDVFVEYAKASPYEILIRITIENRGPEAACLHVLPHLWFRNTWRRDPQRSRPSIERAGTSAAMDVLVARDAEVGTYYLQCEAVKRVLFTDNETNTQRLFNIPNSIPYVKDGIGEYLINAKQGAVDLQGHRTKAAAHYAPVVAAGGSHCIRLQLGTRAPAQARSFMQFDATFEQRRREADEFYAALTPAHIDADLARVLRQSLSGTLWSKQTYVYELRGWLYDRRISAHTRDARAGRNATGFQIVASHVISMPDKWRYPRCVAWDLAFNALALVFVDFDFASDQWELLLRERHAHLSGKILAYERPFGDVNWGVHAWAALFMFQLQRPRNAQRALEMLRRSFDRLLLHFTSGVNRDNGNGCNLFAGGFRGLNTMGIFDWGASRTGEYVEQLDGGGWRALCAHSMLETALELALLDEAYEDAAIQLYEHAVRIAAALYGAAELACEWWDETDGFFYEVLRFPSGPGIRLKLRSIVGLIPLCAVTVFPEEALTKLPRFAECVRRFNRDRPELFRRIHPPERASADARLMLSLLDERKLRRVLARLLDPQEFLSDHGIRSLSRHHRDHPYDFRVGADRYQLTFQPAELGSNPPAENSNWRSPVWFPVNMLLIRALLQSYSYYGDDFRVECPTGSGRMLTLCEVSAEIVRRLMNVFMRDTRGRRPIHGDTEKFQNDPHWRDLLLFYEYVHGDTGAGFGASHQTGSTGLVAPLIYLSCDLAGEAAKRHLGVMAGNSQFNAASEQLDQGPIAGSDEPADSNVI